MSSNEPKLMSKCQFFCNSCCICLCGATLMACVSWKVVLIEKYGYWKYKMSQTNFQYQSLAWTNDV
jgi:hypothetical protein